MSSLNPKVAGLLNFVVSLNASASQCRHAGRDDYPLADANKHLLTAGHVRDAVVGMSGMLTDVLCDTTQLEAFANLIAALALKKKGVV